MKHDLAHPLEQQIYKDSVERLTARYVDAKYGYNFTGAFQAFLLCLLWLILCPIVFVEFRSSDPRLLMQIIAFFVVLLMMVLGILFFLLFLVLSVSDSASIPGSINSARRKKLLKRECSQEVSLFRLQDHLLKMLNLYLSMELYVPDIKRAAWEYRPGLYHCAVDRWRMHLLLWRRASGGELKLVEKISV